jgi:hypothetical protein
MPPNPREDELTLLQQRIPKPITNETHQALKYLQDVLQLPGPTQEAVYEDWLGDYAGWKQEEFARIDPKVLRRIRRFLCEQNVCGLSRMPTILVFAQLAEEEQVFQEEGKRGWQCN